MNGDDLDIVGSWEPGLFPHLSRQTYHVASPIDPIYNCIAWAAGCTYAWWWPNAEDCYWPPDAPQEESLEAFVAAFQIQGYELCEDGDLELGFEKVALFAEILSGELPSPTHAAIQLENGHWSSKMGDLQDIVHYELESVNGPGYGFPVKFLRRKREQ